MLNVTVIVSFGNTGCSLLTRAVAPASAPGVPGILVKISISEGSVGSPVYTSFAKTSKPVPGMSKEVNTKSPPFTSITWVVVPCDGESTVTVNLSLYLVPM